MRKGDCHATAERIVEKVADVLVDGRRWGHLRRQYHIGHHDWEDIRQQTYINVGRAVIERGVRWPSEAKMFGYIRRALKHAVVTLLRKRRRVESEMNELEDGHHPEITKLEAQELEALVETLENKLIQQGKLDGLFVLHIVRGSTTFIEHAEAIGVCSKAAVLHFTNGVHEFREVAEPAIARAYGADGFGDFMKMIRAAREADPECKEIPRGVWRILKNLNGRESRNKEK